MKNKENNNGSAFRKWIKDFFTKSIVLKIVSLLFAMLLWGYVLMVENPTRIKTISNVTVNVEGEADLLARKLVLCGDKDFDKATIKVRTQLAEYADLSKEDVTATINLSTITEKGEYTLTVSAKSASGSAYSVTPSQVTVKVDNLVSRRIPIEIDETGDLPEGYWAGNLTAGRTEVDIEGAAEDVANIVKAVGSIDLTNCTEDVNQSVLLTLYDDQGNEVDSSVLLGTLPSVTVRMEVLRMKTVPIDIESALLGTDGIPANYELVSYGVSGDGTVRIVGEAAVIDEINSLTIDPVDVSGRKESLLEELPLVIPDGVRVLDGDTVNLYVNIREMNTSVSLVDVPIDVKGLGRKLDASLSEESTDITINGRVSLISILERADVELYVDLTDLEAGSYEVPVMIKLPKEEMMSDLQWTLAVAMLTVTIR